MKSNHSRYFMAMKAARPFEHTSDRHVRYISSIIAAFAFALLLTAYTSSVSAVVVHGDFVGEDVSFTDVEEETSTPGDPEPLYGTPIVSGNSLLFNPVSFGATSINGGSSDITDGTLSMVINGINGQSITDIALSERGDYTLAGPGGTSATNVSVGAAVFITIMEVDGAAITPFVITSNLTMAPSGGSFELPGEAGIATIWSGEGSIDIQAAVQAAGFPDAAGATKLRFKMNNTLTAFSEVGTVAFIKKKEFGGTGFTVETIPEPSTFVLGALGLVGLFARRLRRKKYRQV